MAGYGFGYGAAGAGDALADVMKQRLAQAALLEHVRSNQAHEGEVSREHDLRAAEFKDNQNRLDQAELTRRGTQLGMGRTPAGDVNDAGAKALNAAGFLVTHNDATLPSTQSTGTGLGQLVTKPMESGPGFNHFDGGAMYQQERQATKDKEEAATLNRAYLGQQKEADRNAASQRERESIASREAIAREGNATRQTIAATRPDHAGEGQMNRSYQYHRSQLDKLATPIEQQHQKLSELGTLLDSNTPTADSMVAPKLLSALVGGTGSGLRMNNAEIDRVLGGAGKFQKLQSAVQQWSLDPKQASNITPEQRSQIRALYTAAAAKTSHALDTLNGAGDELVGASSAAEHRDIYNRARKNFEGALSEKPGGGKTTKSVDELLAQYGTKK